MIKQIQQGEVDLLDVLIRKHYRDIYSFCFRKTNNPNAAADLTQEVFLKFIAHINNYVHTGKFKNYLFTIARNVCHDYFRKSDLATQDIDDFVFSNNNVDFLKVEQSEIVIKALNQLSDIQKDVIILRFYHDMKIKDIAKVTESSLATTKSRLKQGLDKLKKIIKREDLF